MYKLKIIDSVFNRDDTKITFRLCRNGIFFNCDCEVISRRKCKDGFVRFAEIRAVNDKDNSIIDELVREANEEYKIVFKSFKQGDIYV